MSIGFNANLDGSGAVQTNGSDAIQISTSQNVTIPQSLTVNGSIGLPNTFAFKNRFFNGNMQIWQRGTSGFASSNFGPDRWIVYSASGLSASQSTDVPSGFQYSLSLSGTGYPQATQRVESVNCIDLPGQAVTISFWAKQTSGSGPASLGLQFYYAGSTDNWSSPTLIGTAQTFTGTTGWVQYSATFTSLPSQVVNGIQAVFFANTAGAATWLITGAQLEKGFAATTFDVLPFGTQVMLCQRYFCKSSNLDVVATNGATYTNAGMFFSSGGFAYGANNAYLPFVPFPVTMRITPPGVTFINTSLSATPTAGQWSIYNGSTWASSSAMNLQSITSTGFGVQMTGTWSAGVVLTYGAWAASAEIV